MGVMRERLRETGVYFGLAEPPGERRPPVALPVANLAMVATIQGVFFGVITWILDGAHGGGGIGAAVARGVLFGLAMFAWAWFAQRRRAKRERGVVADSDVD